MCCIGAPRPRLASNFLRLGCDAFASDLNPVARLVLKVMLEDIPRRGAELPTNRAKLART
jgi:adenine-specific DNA methylase